MGVDTMKLSEVETLVTVVIPAYNVETTLDATLNSARNQSYQNLEIIVVVDGATDGTEAIARQHAQQDERISIVVTPNCGLCPARNTGARAGSGAFIAPLDADDIWHRDKIQKQLDVFAAGGDDMGMVYTLFRRIDQWDYLIRDGALTCWSGDVFHASLLYNCVGNGSSIMVRRSAFEQVGGYAMELNRVGCEDYLLQILISHDWRVGVVPEYMTGYRYDHVSMSRNHVRMALARLKLLDIVAQRHPDVPEEIMQLARAQARAELAISSARAGKIANAVSEFSAAFRINVFATMAYSFYRLRDLAYRFIRSAGANFKRSKPPRFQDMDPKTHYGVSYHPLRSRTMRRLLRQSSVSTRQC
ncbi:glycosyltransferase family 2 protein [Roseobacter denitrificans]|nr:glycosyltransferase family 2 protein [Roseobacter denitrificans]